MRKLASIRIIEDVNPIAKVDFIERVRIGGWRCVVKKGEFKIGDKCVYFEIDSLLPIREPFLFLEKTCAKAKCIYEGQEVEGLRLRTMTFRGQVSQGLALPLSMFPGITDTVGEDVTKTLNVAKYELILTKDMADDIAGCFPGYISKTDEERIQNLTSILDEYRGRVFYESEKVDGTSSTFAKYDNEFDAYQKAVRLKRNSDNVYWKIVRKYNLLEKLPNNFAIQGEVVGPGVEGKLGLSDTECFVFGVFDINTAMLLGLDDMCHFVKDLGMKTVPIIDENFILNHTCDQLLELVERKSLINPKINAEGAVFRLRDSIEKISFKVISNKYEEP